VVDEDYEDGTVYSNIYWEGDLDEENTIDGWGLIATTAEGLTKETVAGFLDRYYFPEMEKYDLDEDGVRGKTAARLVKAPRKNRNAQKVKNLKAMKDLKYVLR